MFIDLFVYRFSLVLIWTKSPKSILIQFSRKQRIVINEENVLSMTLDRFVSHTYCAHANKLRAYTRYNDLYDANTTSGDMWGQ